jgi:hypothetical protein
MESITCVGPQLFLLGLSFSNIYLRSSPFLVLGIFGDLKSHEIGVGVTDGISFGLIYANNHLWLDPNSLTTAKARSVELSLHFS